MNRSFLLFLTSFACAFFLLTISELPSANAEEGDTSGDIDFKDLEEQKRLPYSQLQEGVIEYFSSFEASLSNPSDENDSQLRTLRKNELDYLAALYLYCSLQRGSCPVILDSLLETDVFNSAAAEKSSCPNMTGFWKAWIAADMERRLDHGLKVGLIGKAATFKKKERPTYIKCKSTIAGTIKDSKPGSDWMNSRYASSARPLKNIKAFNRYLAAVQEKVPNVFSVTNTR